MHVERITRQTLLLSLLHPTRKKLIRLAENQTMLGSLRYVRQFVSRIPSAAQRMP